MIRRRLRRFSEHQ